DPEAGAQKWLLKSEPDEYSWDHLKGERDSTGFWDGVRNHQAKNILKSMKIGDQAFFYHSSCKVPGIVGIAEVCSEAVPDHTALDVGHKHFDAKSDPAKPTWVGLHVKTVRQLKRQVTLTELKTHKDGALSNLTLLRVPRLSCQPVSKLEWDFIVSLAEQDSA
ncbi:PUA-like domain-containing protein, partial [Baffinella frigidus]